MDPGYYGHYLICIIQIPYNYIYFMIFNQSDLTRFGWSHSGKTVSTIADTLSRPTPIGNSFELPAGNNTASYLIPAFLRIRTDAALTSRYQSKHRDGQQASTSGCISRKQAFCLVSDCFPAELIYSPPVPLLSQFCCILFIRE